MPGWKGRVVEYSQLNTGNGAIGGSIRAERNPVNVAGRGARNGGDDHPFAASGQQFARISGHFTAPTPEEGFDIVRHFAPEGP